MIRASAPQPIKQTGKIFTLGNYLFLSELGTGVHVFDNSDPRNPKNLSFIAIPGNADLGLRGNTLYADQGRDLVTLDITDPANARVTGFTDNVFPTASYSMDTNLVVVRQIQHDTTVEITPARRQSPLTFPGRPRGFVEDYLAVNAPGAGTGRGGSMARFAIIGDRMYTVGMLELSVFNIAQPSTPVKSFSRAITWGVETIYPFRDKLFIGSTSGMFVFSLADKDNPTLVGQLQHATACDPVVANEQHAFVTLRSGSTCGSLSNQLDVVDIGDLSAPGNQKLLRTYPMNGPHGLGIHGNLLFVCDGTAGLRVFDAADVMDLRQLEQIKGMDAIDVIVDEGQLLLVAREGIYQYRYTAAGKLSLLSRIPIGD